MNASTRLCCVLLLSFVVIYVECNIVISACDALKPTNPDPRYKYPPVLGSTTNYRAVYEYNNKSSSGHADMFAGPMVVEENFDILDGLFVFKMYLIGTNATYLEEEATKQVYVVEPDIYGEMICKVQDPNKSYTYLDHLPRLSIHQKHAYYLQQLLTLDNKKYLQGYKGSVTNHERGISANRWDYCIDNTTRVSTYWSPPTTKTLAGKGTSVPLWIEIHYPGDSDVETINVFYFKENEIDQSALQTPEGVYCPGRKSTKEFPIKDVQLKAFRFRGEEYSTLDEKYISWSNHWVDFNYEMQRIDATDPDDDDTISQIIIHKSGYGFEINRNTGSCYVGEIDDFKDDGSIFQSVDKMDFAHPKFLFGDENTTYTYVGNRYTRGMKTDVYQALRPNYPVGFDDATGVSELYFKTLDGDPNGHTYPVTLFITPYNHTSTVFLPGDSFRYYFYDWHIYEHGESDLSAYDVTTCYPFDERAELIVKLNLTVSSDVESTVGLIDNPVLKQNIRDKLAFYANVLPFKVTNLRTYIDNSDKGVYVGFTVLGLHPDIYEEKPTLENSVQDLQSAVNGSKIKITVKYQGKMVHFSVVAGTMNYIIPPSKPFVPHTTTTTPKTTTTTPRTTTTTTPRRTTTTTPRRTTTTPQTKLTTTSSKRKTTTSPPPPRGKSTTPAKKTTKTKQPTTLPTQNPKDLGSHQASADHLFTSGTLGGAAVGSLLGGLVMGAILTFVQVKFLGGKFFGVNVL